MGECIGLDFGTTYSVVAYLDKRTSGEAGTPTPIDFGGEEKSITSMETMVVNSKGITRIGYEAVPVMRVKGAEVFKGFKMLLNSTDEQEKSRRGYTGNNTPEAITSTFMTELFKKVWNAAPDCREIDKVVVGVPYVWTQNGEDSRKFELVDIVKQATGAEIVEFQSEPTLACAYFVQEINKKRVEEGKAHFDGYILVIDYGGGTLDVTLCKADEQDGKSNIKVCNSWGAGENTEGQIGSAGLAYMERVADLLLEENEITNVLKEDKDYQAFVKYIEVAIKDQSGHLKDCINRAKRYFTPGGARYEEEVDGISAYYKGEEYFVKYKREIIAVGGKIVAYYNGKDQIRGYAVMIPQGDELRVEEIIYLDAMALVKLCNAALQEKKTIHLLVSEAEDLTKVFPNAKVKTYGTYLQGFRSYISILNY